MRIPARMTDVWLATMMSAVGMEVIPLWPEGVPGRIEDGSVEETTREGGIVRVRLVHEPSLQVFPAAAENNRGTGVVICPGGGYGIVAIEHEGFDVARWFNTFGVTAFVLKYRVSPYRHPIPLMDVQRALRIVRSRASVWGVDPERIGVMGFSAGGHLASTVMTHGDRPVKTDGPLAGVGCGADFAILGYPVVSFVAEGIVHQGSVKALLGPRWEDRAPREELSAERQVTARTPPAFLFHAKDDGGVLPANSLVLAEALREAGVAAEVFLLESGGHGFGLRRSEWIAPCMEWLRSQGFAGTAPR